MLSKFERNTSRRIDCFSEIFEVCNNTSDIFVFLPRLVQKCQKEQIQTLRNLI